jgi:16S rRNA G966 N2-methylase RsmD
MKDISPYDYFNQNKQKIYDDIMRMYGKVNYELLDIYLYKNIKQCTNFYTPLVLNILNYFKPNSWLDFSAGWGDRLIGAIAYGMNNKNFKYTGVDPSKCMKKRYKKIIKKLGNSNYTIINKPFEDTNILDKFDLVFTSPPFFDLEIYENEEEQSFNRYNTIDKWINGFMKPAIDKSIELLNTNGHLALYIADSMNDKYVDITNNYINNLQNVKYIGNLYWFNKSSSKKLRVIRVWKKI